jgi:hypothetical protein
MKDVRPSAEFRCSFDALGTPCGQQYWATCGTSIEALLSLLW